MLTLQDRLLRIDLLVSYPLSVQLVLNVNLLCEDGLEVQGLRAQIGDHILLPLIVERQFIDVLLEL